MKNNPRPIANLTINPPEDINAEELRIQIITALFNSDIKFECNIQVILGRVKCSK